MIFKIFRKFFSAKKFSAKIFSAKKVSVQNFRAKIPKMEDLGNRMKFG